MSGQYAINKFAQGTVDANGNVTIQFIENPGQGYQWQGNVNVINSPSAGIWTLAIGFQQVGNWTGSAPFGPVKMINQDTALISGSGLQPGVMLTAQFTGWVDFDDGSVVIPNNVPQTAISVETVVPLLTAVTAVVTGGLAIFNFRPPQNTRRVSVVLNTNNINNAGGIAMFGNQTKALYGGGITPTPWTTNFGVGSAGPLFLPTEPLIDQTYQLVVGGANGDIITAWVLASQTSAASVLEGGATTIDGVVNVQPGFPAINTFSAAVVSNGTTVLLAPGTVHELNTAFICIGPANGVAQGAIQIHGGNTLLLLATPGTTTISLNGFQTSAGIDLVVAAYASGFVGAGITYT